MDIKLTHKQADYYTSVFDLNGKVKSDDKTEFYFFGGFGCAKSRIVMLCVNQI